MHTLPVALAAIDYLSIVRQSSPVELAVLALLVAVSVVSWALIAVKAVQLNRARDQSITFLDTFWKGSRLDAIYQSARNLPNSPISRVFCAGYEELSKLAQSKDAKENARFPSRAENAEGYFLTRAVMQWFCGHYLANAADGNDWRASPLRAKTLAGLAPAVVTTAWFDPLRDEGAAYAKALSAAGVNVKYHAGEGLIHGYFGLVDASDTARAEAQRARADFKAMLEQGV